MIDYKLLEALALVVEEGGFEKAARKLFLTQSAISQRIKMLEEAVGQILLTRTTPPSATSTGLSFLAHYRKVKELENDLPPITYQNATHHQPTFAIGVNADSLATWFLDAVEEVVRSENLLLDIHVDDQEETQKLLLTGQVCGCISTHSKPIQGCRVAKLGTIEYGLYCTPSFAGQWFADGFQIDNNNPAPIIRFNRKDHLHSYFFNLLLGATPDLLPTFFVPSSEKFVDCILRNLCYGLIPEQQSKALYNTGQLIDLAPSTKLPLFLYYHHWNLQSRTMGIFTRKFLAAAATILRQ